MKDISTFIKESVEWVGSGWEPSCCYQLIENHIQRNCYVVKDYG